MEGTKRLVGVIMPVALAEQAKELAHREGRSVGGLLRHLLVQRLEQRKRLRHRRES
jgi:hypothetical protein